MGNMGQGKRRGQGLEEGGRVTWDKERGVDSEEGGRVTWDRERDRTGRKMGWVTWERQRGGDREERGYGERTESGGGGGAGGGAELGTTKGQSITTSGSPFKFDLSHARLHTHCSQEAPLHGQTKPPVGPSAWSDSLGQQTETPSGFSDFGSEVGTWFPLTAWRPFAPFPPFCRCIAFHF